MYLPTVHRQPAVMGWDGYQLCVGGGRSFKAVLLPSLREVRKQIATSVENRRRDGLDESDPNKYGYVLVRVGD